MRTASACAAFVALWGVSASAEGHECFDKGALSYTACPSQGASFAGYYIGGHAGAVSAKFRGLFDGGPRGAGNPLDPTGPNTAGYVGDDNVTLDDDDAGFAWGGQIGAMAQFDDGFTLGFEVDLTFANLEAGATNRDEERIDGKIDYFGSARVRAGYAFDDIMPFATGGVGMVSYEHTVVDRWTSDEVATFDESAVGAVVGGGVEYLLTESIVVRAEGLYYFVEDEYALPVNTPYDADEGDFVGVGDLWTTRAGVNFQF